MLYIMMKYARSCPLTCFIILVLATVSLHVKTYMHLHSRLIVSYYWDHLKICD